VRVLSLLCLTPFVTGLMPQRDLCGDLQRIAADAPNGFRSLRGEQTRIEGRSEDELRRYFTALHWPAGATSCEISENMQMSPKGRHYPNYSCDFTMLDATKSKAQNLDQLAHQISRCLDVPPDDDPDVDEGTQSGQELMSGHDMSIQVLLGPGNPTISVSIQSETQ